MYGLCFFFHMCTSEKFSWSHTAAVPNFNKVTRKQSHFQLVLLIHISSTQKTNPNQTKSKKSVCIYLLMGSSKWCREEFSTAQERPALFEETKRGIRRPFMVLSEDRCWLRVGCRAEQLAISASRRSSLTAGATALLPLGLVGSRSWQTLLCHWLGGYLEGYDELNRGCSLENAAWGGAEEGR